MYRTAGKRRGERTFLCAALLLVVHGLMLASPSEGSGLELSGMGPRGRAMGYAMVAIADDWTALHYNPAGIVQIKGAQTGAEFGLMIGRVTSTQSLRNLGIAAANPLRGDIIALRLDEPSSFNEDTVRGEITGGALGYVYGGQRLAFGVGVYGSGAASSWEDTIGTLSGDILTADISFANTSIDVPIAVAYEVSDGLSFGLCIGLHKAMFEADNNKYRTGLDPYVLAMTQDTDGFGVSADLGVLWQANDRFAVGAVMKFPYTREASGWTRAEVSDAALAVSVDTDVEIDYPARFALGCAFRPDDMSVLGFSMTWHDWSEYNQRTVYATQIPTVLENSSGNPGNWEDTTVLSLGYERRLDDRRAFRCGIARDEAPEPVEARTLVGGQVVDTWKFSVGAGVSWGRIALDLGYMYSFGPEVDGYLPGAGYSSHTHEVSIGVQASF